MTKAILSFADIPGLLKIGESTARETGRYLLEHVSSAKIQRQKSQRDDLLDVDLEAEHLILSRFHQETPRLGTLSEEAGPEGNENDYWVIDPLDGSANFQHRNPTFAIAIALVINKKTVAGIIYLPTNNEMFTTLQHQGAYLNEKSIHVSQVPTLDKAIIHIGDFTKANDAQTIAEGLKDFSKLAIQTQRVRMIGTAATDLAYVSCGRADALINHAVQPWDTEAGKLLLREAGGQFSSVKRLPSKPLCIYSNGIIHQSLKEILTSSENNKHA